MKKSSNPSKKPRKCPKNTGRPKGATQPWRTSDQIHALGKEFKEWCRAQAEDPRSRFTIAERFWVSKDVHPNTPLNWVKNYPEFKNDYEIGKVFLGCKKAEGAITKEYDTRAAHFQLHQYIPSFKDADKYHADLKNVKDAVAVLLGKEFEVPDLEDK